jgi:ligand-binding sensor domain-containing protein
MELINHKLNRLLFQLLPLITLCLFCPAEAKDSYYFTVFSSRDGLMGGTITGFHKDKKGFLWLLSENGLGRFDGYEFTTFRHIRKDSSSLPSSAVYSSFVDDLGHSYFYTQNTLVRYTGKGFHRILNYNDFRQVKHLCNDSLVLLVDQNTIYRYQPANNKLSKITLPSVAAKERLHYYFTVGKKLYLFFSKTCWVINLTNGEFYPLRFIKEGQSAIFEPSLMFPAYQYKDDNGNIWVSACEALLLLDKNQEQFEIFPPRASEKEETRKRSAYITRVRDYVYVCSNNGYLEEVNLKSGVVNATHLQTAIGIKNSSDIQFYGVVSGLDNNIWVQSNGAGLIRLEQGNIKGTPSLILNTSNSALPTDKCGLVLDFNPDVLWLYASGTGLVKVEKLHSRISTIGSDNSQNSTGPDKNIRSVFALSDSQIVAASLNGVYKVDLSNGVFTTLNDYSGQNLFSGGSFGNIAGDKEGNIWISMWGKNEIILHNEEKKVTSRIVYSKEPAAYSAGIRGSVIVGNSIFFGAGHGRIYRLNAGSSIQENSGKLTEVGLKKSSDMSHASLIFSLLPLNDYQILLGTSNGLFVLNLLSDSVYRYRANEISNSGLLNADIRDMIQTDDGNIWIATNGSGIFQWQTESKFVINYDEEEGLTESALYTLAEDSNKNLWIGTSEGLICFNRITKAFTRFSQKDGILFKEFNTNAVTKMNDGRFVFGGINGLVVFRPEEVEADSSSPEVLLKDIMVNNKPMAASTAYELRHDENSITFHYGALAFYRTEEIKYEYMLEGLDQEWIPSDNRRFTTYVNLEPGNYIFKVRSTNGHGITNPTLLKIDIAITPPWYQTWTARLFFGIAILLLIYGFYEYRARQRQNLQKIRDDIARDLHDEIGSNLSSISIFNEVAREKLSKNPGAIPPVLDKIGQYAQISQEAMNDIVWMIDSRNDQFDNILFRMRTLASETIGTSSIELHLHFDETPNNLKLDMLKRKNLYLIYKEAINNLLKYSEAKNVWIELKRQNSEIQLTIRDDGRGFDPDLYKGNGLINMRKRASEMNGEFNVESAAGGGTTIQLIVPA